MAFDENASVGTGTGENILQKPPATEFKLPASRMLNGLSYLQTQVLDLSYLLELTEYW